MRYRAAVVAILCALLAGCDAAVTPSASSVPISPTPAIALATASPTTPAVATPTPKPPPTKPPLPAPPKPTGLKSQIEVESICDGARPGDTCAIGDTIYTLSWKAPRTKGVEIRVYGVTTCFGEDSSGTKIDGRCLREHIALPSSIRVLLATARASKGKVTVRLDSAGGLAWPRHSKLISSIVVAAYNAEGGHSIFAIANAGDWRHGGLRY